MDSKRTIRVGSRKSELALIQTHHVISLLKSLHPNVEFEIVTMSTLGDKILDIPLPKIGEKSLFTKELETALASGCVDFVVHSLKDLPTTLPEGMAIGAVLEREDPRDALVLRQDCQELSLEKLPKDSVIGTSSLRRTAQLAKKYPHLRVESIRGNLNTRLRKLDELGNFHAIILAAAGLHRMGWNHRISKVIDEDSLLYAVGQGALAVECREHDVKIVGLLRPLYDPKTALRVITERSFLRTLGGGCSAPVAVTTNLVPLETKKFKMALKGAVWSLDGKDEILEATETILEIKDCKRCAMCPYGYKSFKVDSIIANKISCSENNCRNTDIECLNQCSFKRPTDNRDDKELSEVPVKKQKVQTDNHNVTLNNNISSGVLKDDPHEHCPMKLPVGVDFMGKCPYLESNVVNIYPKRCPVYGKVESVTSENTLKCPFLNGGVFQLADETDNVIKEQASTSSDKSGHCLIEEKSKLYVGLVPHMDIPDWSLDEALNLGKTLAEKLMKNGAIEVMNKAQAVIRSN